MLRLLLNAASPQRLPLLAQCTRTLCAAAPAEDEIRRQGMVNKLLYRSRQRGFLELDLMVGLWAEQEVPKMPAPMLNHFSQVLDLENPDLFKWLTGQVAVPDEVVANPAFSALRSHVKELLGQKMQPATQAAPGKEWVRGWDDSSAKKSEEAGTIAAVPEK